MSEHSLTYSGAVIRAAPLPPAQRREAILDAVLPLVLEHGREVSTRQIAEASGIAEGTIYRAFTTKSALIDAALQRALASEQVLDSLRTVPLHEDLETYVARIVDVLQEHARTTHRLARLMRTAEGGAHPPAGQHRDHGQRLLVAVTACLEPHAGGLGVPPQAAASAILALSFGSVLHASTIPPATIAAVLLHGIGHHDPKAMTCS